MGFLRKHKGKLLVTFLVLSFFGACYGLYLYLSAPPDGRYVGSGKQTDSTASVAPVVSPPVGSGTVSQVLPPPASPPSSITPPTEPGLGVMPGTEVAALPDTGVKADRDLPPVVAAPVQSEGKIIDQSAAFDAPAPVTAIPDSIIHQTPPMDPAEARQAGTYRASAPISIQPGRYVFDNRSSDVVTPAVRGSASEQSFNPATFAPMDEDIELVLRTNVASNNFEVPVSASVWYPKMFRRNLLLTPGDKIIGSASSGKSRDRIIVKFNKIIFKDGRSTNIDAVALDMDGTVGVKGIQIGSLAMQMLEVVLPELASGAAQFLMETEQRFNGVTGDVDNAVKTDSLQNAGVRSMQGALGKIQQLLAEDMEENRPYILALAGTRFKARLMSPLDISGADYGK